MFLQNLIQILVFFNEIKCCFWLACFQGNLFLLLLLTNNDFANNSLNERVIPKLFSAGSAFEVKCRKITINHQAREDARKSRSGAGLIFLEESFQLSIGKTEKSSSRYPKQFEV